MQIRAGATTKSNKIGWGVYTTLGTIRALMWFCWSYCGVRKHRGESFESGIFEDEPLVLNFLLRSFHPPRQTSVQGRNVCESLSTVSCCSSFFSLSPSPPLPHPSILSVSRCSELDNENNEFGVCFSLCVCRALPQLLSLHLARPVSLSLSSLVVTLCHTLTPRPNPPPPTPTLIFLFCVSLQSCFVVCSCCSQISQCLFVSSPSPSLHSPPCLLSLFPSLSVSFFLSLGLSMWFHAPAALLSVCLRLC